MKRIRSIWNWFQKLPWGIRYFTFILVISAVLEILYVFAHLDLFSILWEYKVYIGSIGFFLKYISAKVKEEADKQNSATTVVGQPSADPLKNAALLIRTIFHWGRNNYVVSSVIVIAFFFLSTTASAHFRLYGHMFQAVGEFFSRMEDTDGEEEGGNTGQPPDSESDATVDEALNPPIDEKAEEGDGGTKDSPSSSAFLAVPDRLCQLPADVEQWLFFQGGPYAVRDWTSAESVAAELWPFVLYLRSIQLPNTLDDNIPPEIKADIAFASELEAIMTNSQELDFVMSVRYNIWDSGYQKYSLADLQANSMQRYALEYQSADGHYTTIKYYYAYSIFWSWHSLTFSSATRAHVKDVLHYISMRYHDIADVAERGSVDEQCATTLYEAFELLKDIDYESLWNESQIPNMAP